MDTSLLNWTPSSGYPTSTPTSFKSIATDAVPALVSSLSNAYESIQTATYRGDLISLSQAIRGAEASLTMISGQQVLATATDASVKAQVTEALAHAAYNLHELADEENLYGYDMSRGGNIFFFVIFTIIALFNVGMLVRSRYHWYNVTFICGYILQVLGFLGRILAFTDNTDLNFYLLQYVTLTISPAFIMGGVYFLFAQCVVVHGRQYSVLKPMWYSYFFVASDVTSLIIQGIGGGMASVATKEKKDTAPGTWVMFGGILFQVVAMTIFLVFWFEFMLRQYFRDRKQVAVDSPYKKKSFWSFSKLLINTPSAAKYQSEQLEPFYNPNFQNLRKRPLVRYFNLAITVGVIVIYIRCIYRVVELKQGFSGYLVTHEAFLLALDATMIAIAGLIFIPFHPVFVFGKENVLKLATIRLREDAKQIDMEDMPSAKSSSSS